MAARRIAVLGGGVAGLVAARRLAQASDVTLFEQGPTFGGKLTTVSFRGRLLDPGPDAFIRRNPAGVALASELGLGDSLISPSARGAALYSGRQLTPLPGGLAIGIPTSFRSLWASRLLSRTAVLRAGVDLLAGPLLGGGRARRAAVKGSGDPSVAEVIAPRLGRAVLDSLVDPLVGGINASDVDALSFSAALPQLLPLLGGSRSLMRALRPAAPPPRQGHAPPVFAGLEPGIGRLVEALVDDARRQGAALRTGCAVTRLRASTGAVTRWSVESSQGIEEFDALVLALPAWVTAQLFGDVASALTDGLRSIPYAGVVTATFAFPQAAVPDQLAGRLTVDSDEGQPRSVLPGAGVLVARASGALATAMSFTSTKWPRSAAPGEVVLRLSAGRHGDDRASMLDDDDLSASLLEELGRVLGITAAPLGALVTRYPDSFPQYVKGHAARVSALRRQAGLLPPVVLVGAAYDGIGIPACIASAESGAEELLRALTP